jgi:hypothetical protein
MTTSIQGEINMFIDNQTTLIHLNMSRQRDTSWNFIYSFANDSNSENKGI